MAPSGEFVVVWESGSLYTGGPDGWGAAIVARAFDAQGAPLGDERVVNRYSRDDQRNPAVASSPRGDFVVVWDSLGSAGTDQNSFSVHAQRFGEIVPRPIFVDRFESGDLRFWSTP